MLIYLLYFYLRKTKGMQQTAIEYLDGAGLERMREEILTLLGLTHAPDKQAPHSFNIKSAGNHTVSSP